MKRLKTLTATSALLGACMLGPAAANAATIGGACTAAQWGTSASGLTCGQLSKTRFAWVRLPTATGSAAPSATAPVAAAGTKPTASFIPTGQWLIGAEVTPGTYRSAEPKCYYERLAGFSGSIKDTIANGFTEANGGIVTIDPTDKAFTSHCSWTKIG